MPKVEKQSKSDVQAWLANPVTVAYFAVIREEADVITTIVMDGTIVASSENDIHKIGSAYLMEMGKMKGLGFAVEQAPAFLVNYDEVEEHNNEY